MVGVLLVTHNGLGDSMVDCVRHVLGRVPDNLRVLSVLATDEPEDKTREGRALVEALDSGDGVLLLADMFGATPSNIGCQLCHLPNVKGVAGGNLPMLLRAVCNSDKSLDELAQMTFDGGRDCIVSLNPDSEEGCNAATRCTD